MENILTLHNEVLTVDIRLPGSEPESERFDSACVVKQVTLNGMHHFCQPEQRIPSRVTCWGFGLSAEYDMNDIAREARAGELFPKPGVGLMTQLEDGLPYDMWRHYEIRRFPKHWVYGTDWIEFTEEPLPCRGIALHIRRRLELKANVLTLTTTVENQGKRRAELSEYQHNFVAIDDIPVDKGYILEVPFDGTLGELPQHFRSLPDYAAKEVSRVCVNHQEARWIGSMDNCAYHKTTGAEAILSQECYYWRLSHTKSLAAVSETTDFKPCKLVIWGIEHCVCCEVYCAIDVRPRESQTYVRSWRFTDELTEKG